MGLVNGWDKYGGCGSATITPYYLRLDTFCSKGYAEQYRYNGFNQSLAENMTGNITISLNTSLNRLGTTSAYYIIEVEFLNASGNIINNTQMVRTSYTGDTSFSVLTKTINLYNNVSTSLRFRVFIDSEVSSTLNARFLIHNLNAYKTDEAVASYQLNGSTPSDNLITGSDLIDFDAYSNLANDSIKFYWLENPDDDFSSKIITFYNLSHITGNYFTRYWGSSDGFNDSAFYVSNKNGNAYIIKNITMTRIPNLENFTANYNSILKRFEISFLMPDKWEGYDIYQIILRKEGSYNSIYQFVINESGWDIGTKRFNGFWADKSNEGFLTVYYDYDFTLNPDKMGYLEADYKFRHYFGNFSGDWEDSFESTDWDAYLFNLGINTWTAKETLTGEELSLTDSVFEKGITITPTINNINLPQWDIILENDFGTYNYVLLDYYASYYLNLSNGWNNIKIMSFNFFTTAKQYNIKLLSKFEIFNQTLKDDDFGEVCFSNESETTCLNDSMINSFFIETLTDEQMLDDGSGISIITDIYCEKNGSLTLYYSNAENCFNAQFVSNNKINSANPFNSWMTFQSDYNKLTHESLYHYLLNNSYVLNLEDWEFNADIMGFYRNEPCQDRLFYIPKNVNCLLVQSYYDINDSKHSVNISFSSAKSLKDEIVSNSEDFKEIVSQCSLGSQTKKDLFGNTIPYDFFDYLGYGTCKVVNFLETSSGLAYKVGFLILAVILSNYLLDLFGIKGKK